MFNWKKIGWYTLTFFGMLVAIFGVFGNLVVMSHLDFEPEVLNAGYVVISIGLGLMGLGLFKLKRMKSKMDDMPVVHGLGPNEEVLDKWPYRVKTGFLRYDKLVAVLTNQRFLACDYMTRRMFFQCNLSEIVAVAKNRKMVSDFSHSFSHIMYNNQFGSSGSSYGPSFGSSSGSSHGISQTIGDLDIMKGNKLVFWLTGLSDPDSIVERIRVIQHSRLV